jgi:chemotaxis family two-component system response regulator PixG
MRSSSPHNHSSFTISETKKLKLLRALTGIDFSGKVIWEDHNDQWVCFYEHGRLLYAVGGQHKLRRWRRYLQHQHLSPEISSKLSNLELLSISDLDLLEHQEYLQLCALIKTGEIQKEQAVGLIQEIITEVLFDIFLAKNARYRVVKNSDSLPASSDIYLDQEVLFQRAFQLWEAWDKSNLYNYSPDQAPVIRKPKKMQEKVNKQLHQVLTTLLDGRNTLRDVALKTNRDVVQITQALRMFIQLEWIDLLDIPDYAPSIEPTEARNRAGASSRDWGLIACVDDSPLVCQTMERIVKSEGYQYISVLDAQRAIPTLLSKKPDIIFLDLVMPHTNGYEICSQLRKLSKFSTTPIIILSGNDGVVDQVRARLMGATDFVSKPVDSTIILSTIHQYLETSASVC